MSREQIAGRDSALTALRVASRRCAQGGQLVIVRGPRGIGKTRLMEAVVRSRRCDQRWTKVWVDGRGATDRYGIDAVLDVLRKGFDRFGGSGLIDRIDHLARLRGQEGGASAPSSTVGAELSRVFAGLDPVAVFVDDVLEVAEPAPLLLAARRPGCVVVASMADDAAPTPVSAELVALADEVIELGPLSDDEIAAAVGKDLHEDVHHALRVALGPLYGNPGTALATVEALRDGGRLVASDGQLRLADPAKPVPLPEDHELLRRTRELGRLASRLLAAAATLGSLDVDDLTQVADTLGEDLVECGRTVDRLVDAGLLVVDRWCQQETLCPALGASAASEQSDAVRRLRAAMPTAATDHCPVSAKPQVVRERTTSAKPSWSSDEARIVDLISMGFTNRRIASEFGVSEKTVEAHLTRLFAKTECRSRVELVAASMQGRLRADDVAVGPGQRAAAWSRPFPPWKGKGRQFDSAGHGRPR